MGRSSKCSWLLVLASLLGCGPTIAQDAGRHDVDEARLDVGDDTEDGGEFVDVPEIALDAPTLPPLYRVLTAQADGVVVSHALEPDGSLRELGRTRMSGGPSFLAVAGRWGVAALEASNEVVMLSIDEESGVVRELGERRRPGAGPTHVSIDHSGRWALVANYTDGTVASFAMQASGLGTLSGTASPGIRAHQILATVSGAWVLVPCLGSDHISVLSFDAADGSLAPHRRLDTARGAGPRHLALGSDARVYSTNETDSTVQALAWDEPSGTLSSLQTLSTLPDGVSSANTTAEILLHPNERFLYVSNRGHDSIAMFAIERDGRLRAMGHAPLMAARPRSMAIDPSGTFLLAAAQDDDVIVRFQIEADGSLTRLGTTATTGSPTFVAIFVAASP